MIRTDSITLNTDIAYNSSNDIFDGLSELRIEAALAHKKLINQTILHELENN